MTAPLPPCPLCGTKPRYFNDDPTGLVFCTNTHKCPVSFSSFTEAAWRRLAAPPLPPEVIAVLEAAVVWQVEINNERLSDVTSVESRLDDVVTAWIAAGRPGLPPEKE